MPTLTPKLRSSNWGPYFDRKITAKRWKIEQTFVLRGTVQSRVDFLLRKARHIMLCRPKSVSGIASIIRAAEFSFWKHFVSPIVPQFVGVLAILSALFYQTSHNHMHTFTVLNSKARVLLSVELLSLFDVGRMTGDSHRTRSYVARLRIRFRKLYTTEALLGMPSFKRKTLFKRLAN